MFDVFYSGVKPNLFAHEQSAESIEQAQELSRTRYFWWVNYLTDYTDFDFLWEPVPWQSNYVHAWSSPWNQFHACCLVPKQADTTQYHMHDQVLPARVIQDNFRTLIACEFDYAWTPHPWEPPYIYVFGNQWWPAVKQPTVEYHVPGATERKYVFYPRAELMVDMTNWSVPDNVDTTTFDFSWRPDPGDPPYIYQFGTQHQRTGGPQYLAPGATDTKYVDQIKIKTGRVATAIYEIDHMDGNHGQIANTTKTVRYFDNYLDTLRRIAKSIPDEHEFVWVCSSVCDYSTFDFTWHPEVWQATMLHVFPSDGEKFGDTFFMHVPTFKYRSEKLQLLDWYDLNFMDKNVPRRPLPVIRHNYDTHVEAVKQIEFDGPLAVYTTQELATIPAVPTVPLWREKTKTIVPLSSGATAAIVPKIAIPFIREQLYDYPYIDKTHKHLAQDQLQDIIFISYDEPDADANWAVLQDRYPRAKRIHGIQGMETALEVAADTAQTPWYFAVFAKTRLHEGFDFSYAPDYMQQPKHYIFNCKNTVNDLEYGHMGIVLYNSQGIRKVNAANNFGIDYTLSFPHESVPVLSCYGSFDQTPYHTWRTAFRETAKLAYFESLSPSVEGAYRLNVWRTQAQGPYADWCLRGANDGLEFFNTTDSKLDTLKQSFRWEWLRSYFKERYGELD